jgi:hypothetical protein
MAYYLDFIQLWYILLTFGFAFGPFESLPQDFSLFWNDSKFLNFLLGNGKIWKSQYRISLKIRHPVGWILIRCGTWEWVALKVKLNSSSTKKNKFCVYFWYFFQRHLIKTRLTNREYIPVLKDTFKSSKFWLSFFLG